VFRYTHANTSEFADEIARMPGEKSGEGIILMRGKARKTASNRR